MVVGKFMVVTVVTMKSVWINIANPKQADAAFEDLWLRGQAGHVFKNALG